jgi:putative transposase
MRIQALSCSSRPQVDHRQRYHGAAMGTEAVRFLVLWMAGWIHSRQLEVIDFLREENRVLREQLGGQRLRFTDDQRRRLAVKGRIVGRRRLGEFAGLVTPDTILRWYRELIARKYDGSAHRRTGRPTVAVDVEQLVVRMATENPTWGYTRLVGAPGNLGHQVGRNTVKRVLLRHGLEPAPARGKRMPWKTFLRTHLGAIAAADFFSVEVLTLTGLVRYLVLFVIDLQTRRVQIGGVVRQAYGAWMTQVARNLTDGVDGFLLGKRYLLHDRDPLFTDEFRGVLAAAGVKCLRLPARSPDLKGYASYCTSSCGSSVSATRLRRACHASSFDSCTSSAHRHRVVRRDTLLCRCSGGPSASRLGARS